MGVLMRAVARYIFRFVLLVTAYFMAGKMATLLAIPPGFATPVWPAAGIALACILQWGYGYLPAILLGSTLTNILIIANQNLAEVSTSSLVVGLGIGTGALLQAAVGAYMTKRFLQFPCRFEEWKHIILLLILGGLIAPLVNACIGPAILWRNDIITTNAIAISSFTWWAGDAIGTILTAPPLLLALNIEVAIKRKYVVLIPTFTMTLLCISIFFNTEHSLQQRQQLKFDNTVSDITIEFRQNLETYEALLIANASFIQSSEYVSSDEFNTFTQQFISKYPSILSLSWNKKVTDKNRAAFEKEIRDQGYPDFHIKDRKEKGTFEKAMPRGTYYPVTYINPYERNETAHGYDTYGPDPVTKNLRRKILDKARDEKRAMSTGRLSVVQAEDSYGLLIYYPVFGKDGKELLGYCAGVFLVPEMVDKFAHMIVESNTDLILYDLTQNSVKTLLYDSRTPNFKEPIYPIRKKPNLLTSTQSFEALGRTWEMHYIQKEANATLNQGWGLWSILLGGLLFTSLLCAFLLIFSAQLYGGAIHTLLSEDDIRNSLFVPIIASALCLILAGYLWYALTLNEKQSIEALAAEEQAIIEHRITSYIHNSIMALRRMGKRWEVNEGTSKIAWQKDAINYLEDLRGLTTVEYVDKTYHVRWVEPYEGNEKAIGLDILFNKKRQRALENSAKKNHITLTPPLDLVQGYRGLISYIPLYINDDFDGFIVGIYDIKALFDPIAGELKDKFHVIIKDQVDIVYSNIDQNEAGNMLLFGGKRFDLYDRTWQVKVEPTAAFISSHKSMLPETILLGGILIALLMGITINNAQTAEKRSKLLNIKTRELKRSETKLLEAQRFQHLIRESNPDYIFVKDTQYHIIDANSAYLSIYPKDVRNSIMGTTAMEHFTPAEAAFFLESDKLAFEKGYHNYNHTVHMPDGSIRTLYTQKIRFENKKGDQFILGLSRDVTEREALIDRLNSSNAELERFAYVASHDMQEPLRMITNFSGILNEDYDDKLDDDGKNYLSMITRAGERMKEMITDLLEYSRMEHAQNLEKPFDADEILKSAIDNLTSIIDNTHANITYDKLPELNGNPMQIMRLLQNLITNAIKYQPEGNTPEIQIRKKEDETHWHISVRDNGLGISQDFAEQIFQPFKRLHSWEQIQGSGLGLSICKKIVENHGGKIWVEPNQDKGSTFHFTIKKKA